MPKLLEWESNGLAYFSKDFNVRLKVSQPSFPAERAVAVLRPFGEIVKLPFDVHHSAADLVVLAEQLKSIEGKTRMTMKHT